MCLKIVLGSFETFDEDTNEFRTFNDKMVLHLNHNLYTMSKWESKYHKSFLESDKTEKEISDYIVMMADEEIDDSIINRLSSSDISKINDYINGNQTATVFNSNSDKGRKTDVITTELIYYWMISFNIPFECQYWHISRLLTLIRVCIIKNKPKNKMSVKEAKSYQQSENARRKALWGTKG